MDWYWDPVNGSDSNSGDSPTVLVAGSDGQTYGTTKFTSASGGLTGTEGRIMRLQSLYRKIVAVVSDTEVTMDDTYASGTNRLFAVGGPTQRVPPISTYGNPGDRVKVPKTERCDAESAGNMTWTLGSADVGIAAGRVMRVDDCDADWVGAANVNVSHATYNRIQGEKSVTMAVQSAFTGGKVAYKTLDGDSGLDFSSFQGLSLVMAVRGSTALQAAHGWRICLCSDTTGDVPVDDLTLIAQSVLYVSSIPVTTWKGGNLSAGIKSVAIYVTSDPGSLSVDIDDIVAVKALGTADHICHSCMLSQHADWISPQPWWGIRCFADEQTVTLNGDFYGGEEGSKPAYRREVVPVPVSVSLSSIPGTVEDPVIFSGGWDFSTDIQDGETIWANQKTSGTADNIFLLYTGAGFGFEHFGFGVGGDTIFEGSNKPIIGFYARDIVVVGVTGASTSLSWLYALIDNSTTEAEGHCSITLERVRVTGTRNAYALYLSCYTNQQISDVVISDFIAYSTRGVSIYRTCRLRGRDIDIQGVTYSKAQGLEINDGCCDMVITGLTLKNNVEYGIKAVNPVRNIQLHDVVADNNALGTISVGPGDFRLFNAVIDDVIDFTNFWYGGRVASIKHGGVADTHLIRDYAGDIVSQTNERHTAADIAWQMSPTNTEGLPLTMKVAEIAVTAGTYYATIWLRRDNTDLCGKFYTPGGQIAGVPDEVSDTIAANANMWEIQILEFTATETGAIEFFVEAKGGTEHSLFVDDFALVSV